MALNGPADALAGRARQDLHGCDARAIAALRARIPGIPEDVTPYGFFE